MRALIDGLRQIAHPVSTPRDYDALIEMIGDASFVLLGEATHGTHEFYQERAVLTRRLIVEKGFGAVAVEADWPDAHRVNRFVRGRGSDVEAVDALADFERFPAWIWRNADVLDFVGWLREHNQRTLRKVGFYGLDLYSLHASVRKLIEYLERRDPEAAKRARARYGGFEEYGDDPQNYGVAAGLRLDPRCEDEVVAELVRLRRDEVDAADEHFFALQNARVVENAEAYYRAMFGSRVSSWNLRDAHMADTLDALALHLGRSSKIVVWAHNSHLGDAGATMMAHYGEINLGQLARQRHGARAMNLGFTTFTGTVSAASEWGGPVERKRVRPALQDSYEALFHQLEIPRFAIVSEELGEAAAGLFEPRLERAIGVLYLPENERASHYFNATLPLQFDMVLHFDETRAVEPLERTGRWGDQLPETHPTEI